MTTPTNVVLSASTATNWSYQLQFRASLGAASSWGNVGPAVSGTGGTVLLGDTSNATNATRFYRVRAQ
ncbi:MAG TPA: hypothetical protein VG347_17955 [Verrucomicrobiae bacterium]|nr:hypothetical protein [Verrucomicrobiae bacterium]